MAIARYLQLLITICLGPDTWDFGETVVITRIGLQIYLLVGAPLFSLWNIMKRHFFRYNFQFFILSLSIFSHTQKFQSHSTITYRIKYTSDTQSEMEMQTKNYNREWVS
jgi:hypothetical protein